LNQRRKRLLNQKRSQTLGDYAARRKRNDSFFVCFGYFVVLSPVSTMGRTYLFECSRCGFRAKVSGRADKGFTFVVQTISCRNCKNLYDAVTRVKLPESPAAARRLGAAGLRAASPFRRPRALEGAPSFQAVLNRLAFPAATRLKWVQFKARCPVSPAHRIELWNDPDPCPKCGLPLEKHPLPFRIWD